MEFIDLGEQQNRIKRLLDQRIGSVLRHGQYIMGPEVRELERQLEDYVEVKNAIGCASGTDALLMALMAYDVGPGDAIFTTPFTFVATGEVIKLLGATPVFVDIEPRTFNIDPAKLEQAVKAVLENDRSRYPLPTYKSDFPHAPILSPKGVIPVDLFGLPASYDRINAIALSHGLFVIEDAAQSFGALSNGRKTCSLADIACTSFFPAKPLGCYGDGGMCFTDDDDLADAMRSIRVHGKGSHKYENVRIGINGRLDTIQAAVLLAKFEIFPEEVILRQKVADHYTELFSALGTSFITPYVPPSLDSVWAQYSILSRDQHHRAKIQDALKRIGAPTAIYYPKPLHLQGAFVSLGYREGDFPVSESHAERIFSIPMHPYLNESDQVTISETLCKL
jgi:UDP-2-acetamido-2-deoxy-ribo-hexuluronate aminotransferase